MACCGKPHGCGKWFWGGILVLLGATFLAGNLGFIETGEVLETFWPLLLVYLGVTMLTGGRRGVFWGLAVLGVGIVFLLQRFDVLGGEVWGYIWPGFLILAGLGLMFKPKAKPDQAGGGESLNVGRLDHSTTFGESRYTVNSQAFEGGKVTTSFGEVHLDLTSATMASDTAELRLECSFGHIVLRTPAAWRIQIELKSVAGGINDHRSSAPATGPVLVLRGEVNFGAVDVY